MNFRWQRWSDENGFLEDGQRPERSRRRVLGVVGSDVASSAQSKRVGGKTGLGGVVIRDGGSKTPSSGGIYSGVVVVGVGGVVCDAAGL